MFAYNFNKGYKTFEAKGTIVHRNYRKFNIVSTMWNIALARYNVQKLMVYVISDRGYTLVKKMESFHLNINWMITHNGFRELRNLKSINGIA